MSAPSPDDPARAKTPAPTEPSAPEPTDPTSPPDAPPPEGPDERLDLWLDARLPADERARFERELAQNPTQRKEAQTLASMLEAMRSLPEEQAPKNLLADVQQTLRERSRGRHFATEVKARFPYEAILQALLLVGALVVFALSTPAPEKLVPVEPKDFLVAGSELGVAARTLGDFGTFRTDGPVDANGWRHLVGEVADGRLEALKTEISLYPSMRLESEEPLGDGRTRVFIAVKQ